MSLSVFKAANNLTAKGQLISKGHFDVFKSTKKPTKILIPNLITENIDAN